MGYLADIVADARDRHVDELGTAYSEEVLEPGAPAESAQPSITADNLQPKPPSVPIRQRPAPGDSAKTEGPDVPPAREHRSEPERAKAPHDASAQQSAQEPLYQYLRQLSQHTLIARSEQMLTQQQTPDAPSTTKANASPASAEQHKPPPEGPENTPSPAATIADTRMAPSDRSAVAPVQANRPAPSAIQSDIRLTPGRETRTAQDTQGPHRYRPPSDAAKNISRDRQPPPPASHAPAREPHTSAPPPYPQELASGAPQLRIGQINVVVESTKTDQDRHSGLERESDSGSRYFLRSL